MLIVFDLDFTLWDAGGTWCDHTAPPYRQVEGYIHDAEDRLITLYPEVPDILALFSEKDIPMALASRTHSPVTARKLISMFGIGHYFSFMEIYPGSKLQHFQALHRNTGLPYTSMFFFDDEQRNIIETASLGVQSFHVLDGLSWTEVKQIPGFG